MKRGGMRPKRTCTRSGCSNPHSAKGLCRPCYVLLFGDGHLKASQDIFDRGEPLYQECEIAVDFFEEIDRKLEMEYLVEILLSEAKRLPPNHAVIFKEFFQLHRDEWEAVSQVDIGKKHGISGSRVSQMLKADLLSLEAIIKKALAYEEARPTQRSLECAQPWRSPQGGVSLQGRQPVQMDEEKEKEEITALNLKIAKAALEKISDTAGTSWHPCARLAAIALSKIAMSGDPRPKKRTTFTPEKVKP